MKSSRVAALVLSVPLLMGADGCDQSTPQKSIKSTQAERAQEAANSISFTDNAEIENIKKRLELTANPGLLGFVILLNEMGQPVLYEGVVGKVSSGSKRLTRPYSIERAGNGSGGYSIAVSPSPSDEGTWGQSGDYIFYWNSAGQYRQWNGKYLYSDKPFRLRIEPLVVAEHAG